MATKVTHGDPTNVGRSGEGGRAPHVLAEPNRNETPPVETGEPDRGGRPKATSGASSEIKSMTERLHDVHRFPSALYRLRRTKTYFRGQFLMGASTKLWSLKSYPWGTPGILSRSSSGTSTGRSAAAVGAAGLWWVEWWRSAAPACWAASLAPRSTQQSTHSSPPARNRRTHVAYGS
mgnify:CR=1 FL=1